MFKTHPLFSVCPTALQIFLYYDDVEVCNPLGANVKKHKLGKFHVWYYFCASNIVFVAVFYYTLGNILPKYRSALQAIQLVTVVKTSALKTYGPDVILEPFVKAVQQLEQVCAETGRCEPCINICMI